MEAKRALQGMIEIYQNDFSCGYEGEDKEELRLVFLELILQMTRYVNDFRYCSRKDCPCSPEFNIKLLVENHGDVIFNKFFYSKFALTEVTVTGIIRFLKQFTAE